MRARCHYLSPANYGQSMDPQIRLQLESTFEALENGIAHVRTLDVDTN